MNLRSAKRDVLDYLASQDDAYFEERETTREAVLKNKDLIEEIAFEHMKCVNDFGCEREWSCKDACDGEPGIRGDEYSVELDSKEYDGGDEEHDEDEEYPEDYDETLSYEMAKWDIECYLASQDDIYFEDRGVTREQVLQNHDLIEDLISEHMKCVNEFGCEREWSCKDACDSEPGVAAPDEEIETSLDERLESATSRSVDDFPKDNKIVVQDKAKEYVLNV